MPRVIIRGAGIAGSCCAQLLTAAGLDVQIDELNRPRVPAVMLTDATQKLLCDVFQREDLFAGLTRIRKRVVLWRDQSQAVTLPHFAVVVSEQELLKRLESTRHVSDPMPPLPNEGPSQTMPDWTIFASAPLSNSSVEQHFGSRLASASAVQLRPRCDLAACWIESLDNGWLFLLPSGKGTAWLLSVGTSMESHLSRSRLICDQIADIQPAKGSFPSHPRVAWPLCASGWLACGTAALGFDPLCGDGVGNAVREAILASAVIRAALGGAAVDSLTAHYQTRLLAGFQRHLALCLEFYQSGGHGEWWDTQIADLHHGLRWCEQHLAETRFHYRLNGFELEPVR